MIIIVSPNYSGNKYLKGCLDSIYKQSYTDYEIIIDNASTDDSYE